MSHLQINESYLTFREYFQENQGVLEPVRTYSPDKKPHNSSAGVKLTPPYKLRG